MGSNALFALHTLYNLAPNCYSLVKDANHFLSLNNTIFSKEAN
eukprot:10294.XXX_706460_706588_1 [CDS] Oithona nana genome sequencing.